MAKLHVEVVTGERIVFQMDDVDMAVVPGVDGMLGILPGHAQLISLLQNGELRVKKGGAEESIVVFGGFVEVSHDRVTILADTAERASEIDLERAEAARARAEETKRNRADAVSIAEAEAALRRAAVRLRIGQRRRGRSGHIPNP
ncbi:MAG: F0F1 ATP synthase subunit epsilon [Thermomicrobiales bacterium]